jgi:hypothetical protein
VVAASGASGGRKRLRPTMMEREEKVRCGADERNWQKVGKRQEGDGRRKKTSQKKKDASGAVGRGPLRSACVHSPLLHAQRLWAPQIRDPKHRNWFRPSFFVGLKNKLTSPQAYLSRLAYYLKLLN